MNEDSGVEFKREYTPHLRKEVVAFANTKGGIVIVGRDDEGNDCPLANIDMTLTQAANSIRDGILPDVTMFVDYDVIDASVQITVQEGTNKPYYLKDKGLKPSGVYVRQGASSVPASFEQIRQMIKLTDGDDFEDARSLQQDLTFKTAAEEFDRQGMGFSTSEKRTLGITSADGLYTNLALLLSDQCAHTIKVAVFIGREKSEFKTRREFEGSILKQLRECYDFLSLTNNLATEFSGIERIEMLDYPEEVLREALLNAIIHRDYSFSGSTIINVYENRMEFVSLGGLVPGLQKEDLFSGISQPRNRKLANIFYRLKLVEAYGTGIRKIMSNYQGAPLLPAIAVTNASFVLDIPNMNHEVIGPKGDTDSEAGAAVYLKVQHQKVIDYLRDNDSITNQVVQELLSVGQTRAYAIIKELLQSGLIRKRSSGRSRDYVLNV
jgi:ATP-dependent DNA helicase RecG